mmetsp:Transcript_55880/g.130969  ORF Transcript_55880/g.130969 Transcript_55880/m.130969 type:complete len:222 (+) Transcript_55880:3787-4452(+)
MSSTVEAWMRSARSSAELEPCVANSRLRVLSSGLFSFLTAAPKRLMTHCFFGTARNCSCGHWTVKVTSNSPGGGVWPSTWPLPALRSRHSVAALKSLTTKSAHSDCHARWLDQTAQRSVESRRAMSRSVSSSGVTKPTTRTTMSHCSLVLDFSILANSGARMKLRLNVSTGSNVSSAYCQNPLLLLENSRLSSDMMGLNKMACTFPRYAAGSDSTPFLVRK